MSESALQTNATTRMNRLQAKFPPIYQRNSRGYDRGRSLAGVLVDVFPQTLRLLWESGQVVVGEIGQFQPSIATYPVSPNEFSIEITTGLMDFYYAVGRAIGGTIS